LMPEHFEEKTEQATPRKREEVRRRGQVARSADVVGAVVLLAGLVALKASGPALLRNFVAYAGDALSAGLRVGVEAGSLQGLFLKTAGVTGILVAPVAAVCVAAALAANLAQVGFVASGEAITPKPERLDPMEGFKRLFSQRAAVQLILNMAKVVVVGLVAVYTVRDRLPQFIPAAGTSAAASFGLGLQVIYDIGIRCGIALLALAALDYGIIRFEFERNIRMSRQEVRDELKETEGDPLVRHRIRSIQRHMARMRMMQRVPSADVVVTNPTHLAIALCYKPGKTQAPLCVAKGARRVAEHIKELARKAGVPVIEDKPLARSLYASVDVGQEIPAKLYRAVAELLAYVFALRRRR